LLVGPPPDFGALERTRSGLALKRHSRNFVHGRRTTESVRRIGRASPRSKQSDRRRSRSIPFMFDRQHKIRGVSVPGYQGKLDENYPGFPLVGSIWNIAARATPSFRASDLIPGSGAFGWTKRRSSPAKLRRGRPQRIPSYGWSIKHWRSCRNRPPVDGLVPSGYAVARNPLSTLLYIAPERIPPPAW
jgi:hypothetical protein